MNKIPITKEGWENLKKEYERMRNVVLPANAAEIEVARAHGDLSENAEYKAAKEKQAFVLTKIKELENNILACEVIDTKALKMTTAVFGSCVKVEDAAGEITTYILVGPFESDVAKNRISVTSPLGKALIGKAVGDEVQVNTPGGIRSFDILEISASGL
ncbi:MAG: transcription elongation factor GreA [Deltaproteobacteria bacterium]|nr:transcription elongation factor GreA [Deltaproteobacteria bacterium]